MTGHSGGQTVAHLDQVDQKRLQQGRLALQFGHARPFGFGPPDHVPDEVERILHEPRFGPDFGTQGRHLDVEGMEVGPGIRIGVGDGVGIGHHLKFGIVIECIEMRPKLLDQGLFE